MPLMIKIFLLASALAQTPVPPCVDPNQPVPPPPPAPMPVPPPAPQPPPTANIPAFPAPTGKIINAKAGDDLNALINGAKAGDEILLADGNYKGGIKVKVSGVLIKALNVGKAVINTSGETQALVADNSSDVKIYGVKFVGGGGDTQDNTKATVITRAGWWLYRVEVMGANGVGIGMYGKGGRFYQVSAHDNGRGGMGGTGVEDGLLQSCKSYANNSKGDSNGGGGKFTRTKSLHVVDHEAYDNFAAGMWFDYNNINVTVEDSKFHDNKDFIKGGKLKAGGEGLFFEISGGVEDSPKTHKLVAEGPLKVIRTHIWNNTVNRTSGDPKSDLLVWGSGHVRIEQSTIGRLTVRNNRQEPSNKIGDNQITGSTINDIWFDPAHKADKSQWKITP